MRRMTKLTAQLTFRVTEADYDRLQDIAADERRKMNEVARALLERGLAAYRRDGQLFEPNQAGGSKGDTPQLPTASKKLGRKKNGRKREIS